MVFYLSFHDVPGAGEDSGRAALAAVGTWQQDLLLCSLPALQPLLSEQLGEVSLPLTHTAVALVT